MDFWWMEKQAAASGGRKRVICDRHKRSQQRSPNVLRPPPTKSTFTFPFFPSRALPSLPLSPHCPTAPAIPLPEPACAEDDTASSLSLSLFPPVFPSPSTPPIEDSFSLTAAAARSPLPHPQRARIVKIRTFHK
ncbi:hypothetical protein MRB53_013527 [Persea americana]|uniref:Uncharacterized protein n=1 Tax=Persea americana TaxID=3435 RepID=A0ACC2K8B6_PERAE|nr:hypothetical protein MRB53_013527 [Persea americana]